MSNQATDPVNHEFQAKWIRDADLCAHCGQHFMAHMRPAVPMIPMAVHDLEKEVVRLRAAEESYLQAIESMQNVIAEWLKWFGSTNDLCARSRSSLDRDWRLP